MEMAEVRRATTAASDARGERGFGAGTGSGSGAGWDGSGRAFARRTGEHAGVHGGAHPATRPPNWTLAREKIAARRVSRLILATRRRGDGPGGAPGEDDDAPRGVFHFMSRSMNGVPLGAFRWIRLARISRLVDSIRAAEVETGARERGGGVGGVKAKIAGLGASTNARRR